jgi:hypothetical protein
LNKKITHALIFKNIKSKLPKDLSELDSEILKDIVLKVGDKDGSLASFYRDVSLYDGFLTLGAINKMAEKYLVHVIYKDYIDKNYAVFEDRLLAIERKASELNAENIEVSFELDAWAIQGKQMFSRTDLLTIEKLGGLKTVTSKLYELGYRQYMRRIYSESADERGTAKYTLAFEQELRQIGGGR